MPCGVSTTATSCLPSIAPFFECCGRLKVQAFKCEAPTGCAGATFPVGFQLNVNEWPSMGEYPVYAMKLFDCVGGKAYVGMLGAVNGVVKYGLDIKIPNTANASALRLAVVDPVTGATIPGMEVNIGLAPATGNNSKTGTTYAGIILDNGVSVQGPWEAIIGTPKKSLWERLWYPSQNEDPGILITTEQRAWKIGLDYVDTGFTAVKTLVEDGYAMSAIDVASGVRAHFAGTAKDGTTVAVLGTAEYKGVGISNAGISASLVDPTTQETIVGSQALLGVSVNGTILAGFFNGNISVTGDATLGGTAFGGWADYVLEPDYELMHLDDVAKYINDNKTLPEMPSADVVATGHGIGAMLKAIVAQLEKQMLYILQLDARLEMEGI